MMTIDLLRPQSTTRRRRRTHLAVQNRSSFRGTIPNASPEPPPPNHRAPRASPQCEVHSPTPEAKRLLTSKFLLRLRQNLRETYTRITLPAHIYCYIYRKKLITFLLSQLEERLGFYNQHNNGTRDMPRRENLVSDGWTESHPFSSVRCRFSLGFWIGTLNPLNVFEML